ARRAQSVKSLQFVIANETRRLFSYRQAFMFSGGARSKDRYRMKAGSSVATIERDAPFVRWAESTLHQARSKEQDAGIEQFNAVDIGVKAPSGWNEYSFPHVLWCPLRAPAGPAIGGLWIARETPWQEREITLAEHLSETYGHAWAALIPGRRLRHGGGIRRALYVALFLALVVAMFTPVRLSTLAPVEVVAKDPSIVSAPLEGVIAEVLAPPNTMVEAGQLLLALEDTALRNQYEVAEKALLVAAAEHRKAKQAAFQDPESNAEVAVLQAELDLRRSERDYARELLERVTVLAPASGLLIYTEEADWVGRPVVTGERIMAIANPELVKLRIDLPVDDAIVIRGGADVDLFLDVDPLHSLTAKVTHASYHAEVTPGDALAFKVNAEFDESQSKKVRIGLQGTAKIYGERVTLFFFLFRRPVAAARQWLGQ
ncbi:MAG: efflux RND transporter periplasmic adaptor subunit, partial [Gammaproteobacteria bacterium]